MLKPVSKQSCVTTVSLEDTALDIAGSDMPSYHENVINNPGCWREFLKVKDGESPTVFTIGVVPSEVAVRIEDECRAGLDGMRHEEVRWRYFLHSVRGIDGWPEEPKKTKIGDTEYIAPDWLKSTFIKNLRLVALEIGTRAYLWNQLSEDDVKK